MRLARLPVALVCTLVLLAGCGGVAASASGPAAHPRPAGAAVTATAGRTVRVWFDSRALGRRRSYLVHLPPAYDARRRYPVLYLLHSAVGWPDRWIVAGHVDRAADAAVAAGRTRPMIVVMPDGTVRRGGPDTEWANTGLGAYEAGLIDTVHAVDARWPTIRSRRGRMLAGVSTGGFAAANVALHHLGLFGAFESWSGYFRETRTDAFTDEPEANLVANSPVDYVSGMAPALRRRPLAAFVYEGDREAEPSLQDRFCARLRAAHGTATCVRYPGGHGWGLWRARMPAMLRWASQHLAGARP